MDLVQLAVTPIVGGVIGYITNWLAIKMLFRPHEQKFFLGMKVPFTPGLIPKERLKLANKVGTTIGEHLLTKDVFDEIILSEDIKNAIENKIATVVSDFEKSNMTINDFMDTYFSANKQAIIDLALKTGNNSLQEMMKNEKFINEIAGKMTSMVVNFLKSPDTFQYVGQFTDYLYGFFLKEGKQFLGSDDCKSFIDKSADDFLAKIENDNRSIKQFFGETTFENVNQFVDKNSYQLATFLLNLLEKPEVDFKLKDFVSDILLKTVGGFAGIFINTSKVYDNIKSGIRDYLSEEENVKQLAEKIKVFMEEHAEDQVNELWAKIPSNWKESASHEFTTILFANMNSEKNSQKIFNVIKGLIEKNSNVDLYGLIVKMENNFDEKINDVIKKYILQFAKNDVSIMAENLLNQLKDSILNKKISTYVSKIPLLKLKQDITRIIIMLLQKNSDQLVTIINIPKIVEERINTFEVEYAEEIIISVVNKELNAITVLGGVLGFIIGCLSLLPQLL